MNIKVADYIPHNDPATRVAAFVTLLVDNSLFIHDIKLIRGPTRLFVAMPAKKHPKRCTKCSVRFDFDANYCPNCGTAAAKLQLDKRYHDIVHPASQQLREQLEDVIIAAHHAIAISITSPPRPKKASSHPSFNTSKTHNGAHNDQPHHRA